MKTWNLMLVGMLALALFAMGCVRDDSLIKEVEDVRIQPETSVAPAKMPTSEETELSMEGEGTFQVEIRSENEELPEGAFVSLTLFGYVQGTQGGSTKLHEYNIPVSSLPVTLTIPYDNS